jgi:RND superfamily putative drug exporter
MFQQLGRIAYRRRRTVLAVWAALFVVGMALSGAVLTKLTAQPPGDADTESAEVMRRIDAVTGDGPEVVAIVGGAPVDDPAVQRAVERAAADLAGAPGVVAVLDHYGTGHPALVATDRQASLVVVELSDDLHDRELRDAADAVASRLRAIDAPEVTVGGSAVIEREFETAVEKDLAAERNALPIAFVVMVVILGGLIAAGLPLLIAFAAVGGSMFVLLAATGVTDVSVYAINVVFMFGLGLGIDYGLLIVSRFREERAAGATVEAAVERSVATAGRTVAFSAMTVAAALAGLFAFDDPTFRSFGIAGIGVVLLSLAAAVTMLPALLGVLGRRVRPAKASRDGHRFFRIAQLVQRHAVLTVVVVGAGLLALAAPFLSARFENGDARYLPRSSEARAVALALGERFPARGADPIEVLVEADGADPAVAAYVADLASMPGVAAAEVRPGMPAGTTLVDVVPEGTSQGLTAQRLVHELRDGEQPFPVLVGGVAAHLVDSKADTAARLPYAFGIIAIATFVLLFLMTGSIAVPLKAIVMNVLSLGASFGALVWGFQEGHLAGVLGFDSVGSLELFMPVLIFIFAFGLSMDYEVFLLGRIKEIYDETGDNDYAVAAGLQKTGGIVTSAALLIVVVFAGFAMGEVLGIKMLGFGLALAVVVDATIVRTLLVPATMKLLGDWNWWAPAPLRRFQERFGLREAPAAVAAVPPSGAGELEPEPLAA